MSSKNYCTASAAVFAIIALMHIWRLVLDLPMQIGAWYVPRSFSLVGAIIAGGLAFWAFKSARETKPREAVYT